MSRSNEYFVLEVEVTGSSDEFSVVRIGDHAPFVQHDDELDQSYEIPWYWKKRYDLRGEPVDLTQDWAKSIFLSVFLEVYAAYGWRHYDTVLTSREHPETADNPDYATMTLLLFFKRIPAPDSSPNHGDES